MDDRNNRAAAVAFVEGLPHGFEAIRPLLADGWTFWTPRLGRFEDRLEQTMNQAGEWLVRPLEMTIDGITAEGDRVAVEARGYGELRNGRIYNNKYHFLFEFSDGKISAVREYNDSKHAHDVLHDLFS